jgi:hypothetical protein
MNLETFGTRFEVSAAVRIQVEVFWVVTPYSIVVGYQRFGGPCCFPLHPDDGGSMDLRNFGILPRRHSQKTST